MMLNKMYHNVKLIALPLLMGGAVMSACSDDLNIGAELTPGSSYIALTLDSNDVETRTVTGSKTPFTEEERALRSVDIFLYTTASAASDGAPFGVYTFTNQVHGNTQKIILSDEEVEALFGDIESPGSCIAFAVVNVDDADYGVTKASATISQLKSIKANTASFATDFDGFAMFTKEENGDVITYDPESRIASGDIKLKNLAAKIDVFISFRGDISANDNTWNVAMSNGIPTAEVHVLNGVTAVKLDGFDKEILTEEDYYSIRSEDDDDYRRSLAKLSDEDPYYDEASGLVWGSSKPYYSYPNSWEVNPLEKHRTSLILKVDWVPADSETDVLTTYYNVPVALDDNQLASNRYYRLKLEINSLGGQHFGEPLELEGTWEALEWGHAELEADIREIRYLEIARSEMNDKDEKIYTAVMNNTETTMIPYYTSHAVQIQRAKVTYRNIYNAGEDGTGIAVDVVIDDPAEIAAYTLSAAAYATGQPGVYIDQVNHNIYVRNPLHPISLNNGQYTYDSNENKYAPFNIEIVLEHVDDPATRDTITIIQYPGLYVEATKNPGGDPRNSLLGWSNKDIGFAYVNDGTSAWGGINGISTGWLSSLIDGVLSYSSNPNMYLITVTNLNESDKPKHLGDPRTTHTMQSLETESFVIGKYGTFRYDLDSFKDLLPVGVDDSSPATWATTAPEWNDGTITNSEKRYLTNYYPTNETPDEYYLYMMAPQFIVQSSYGTHDNTITRNDARKRCATYQENGYPAGRWRLPTVGELQYMADLSMKRIIPTLFSNSRGYWTNHGLYQVDNGKLTEITDFTGFLAGIFNDGLIRNGTLVGYTRCVYDEWYWTYKDSEGNDIPDNFSDVNYMVNKQLPAGYTTLNALKATFHWGDKPKNNPQEQPEITTD